METCIICGGFALSCNVDPFLFLMQRMQHLLFKKMHVNKERHVDKHIKNMIYSVVHTIYHQPM